MRQSWETMTFISAGHIILTPTQPVGSGRPQRGSNPGPPDQESRALPTELPRPPNERGGEERERERERERGGGGERRERDIHNERIGERKRERGEREKRERNTAGE